MEVLERLSPEALRRAENRLLNPAPDSRIAEAKDYGIDLTLLIEQLRLTPTERARKLEEASAALEQIRGAVHRRT